MNPTNSSNRFVRLPEVLAMTGLCRSTIYKLISQGEFPAPYKITRRAVAWRQSDLDNWSNNLPSEGKQ
ncbi:AlpA family transcriptional regulator [Litorivicinus sp.]|nr:AlpA family transcriptional regulator [Litorivicinus sp.]